MFWLDANDDDSLRLSFQRIARQIAHTWPMAQGPEGQKQHENLDQVVGHVKSWLELPENTQWLLIYDNYDNPKIPGELNSSAVDVRKYIPASDHGSIIITTRSSQVRQGQRIHVQRLADVEDGLKILSLTSGRGNIETGIFLHFTGIRRAV